MAEFVGIDLGTTLSGLAYLKPDGDPEIVPNADGERLTPSVVFFDGHEDVKLVGSAARDGGEPDRTIFQIKRHMDDPEHLVEIDGRKWTPAEISALILAKLRRDCSRIIGDINEVVITVPANFNELARKSTIAAAEMAGMKVRRLVNEPTAAAVYYAHSQGVQGRILVYDLGGGTLDVTILEVQGDGSIRILTSEGARHLGGSNFDELLLDAYAEQYSKQTGARLWTDERHRRRILQATEDAKKMLSKLQRVNDTVSNDQNNGIARIDLTRDGFETLVRHMLTRTVMLVEQALDSAKLKAAEIDHVVLVGGSTRIPKVKQVLEKMFGKAPKSCGNVDECVALGAALFAKKSARIQEVCNASYGTLAMVYNARTGEEKLMNSIVIPKNTPIPCSKTQIYQTSEDNERIIEVDITQGEDEDPRYVDIIGRITLEVPPNRPKGCEVAVTFSYDENQRVRALVVDKQSGRSREVAVSYKGAGVLSEEELKKKTVSLRQMRIE
jgi:molecular chaperone DnaK